MFVVFLRNSYNWKHTERHLIPCFKSISHRTSQAVIESLIERANWNHTGIEGSSSPIVVSLEFAVLSIRHHLASTAALGRGCIWGGALPKKSLRFSTTHNETTNTNRVAETLWLSIGLSHAQQHRWATRQPMPRRLSFWLWMEGGLMSSWMPCICTLCKFRKLSHHLSVFHTRCSTCSHSMWRTCLTPAALNTASKVPFRNDAHYQIHACSSWELLRR